MTKISTLIASVVASIFLIFMINTYGGRVEGYFFPVAYADGITFQVVEHDQTVLNGTMKKLRTCEFIGLQAFLTNPLGHRIIAPLRVGESLKLRPQGEFHWGPWIVEIPIWNAQHNMEIMVYHRCNPFYLTETSFWSAKVPNEIPAGENL